MIIQTILCQVRKNNNNKSETNADVRGTQTNKEITNQMIKLTAKLQVLYCQLLKQNNVKY